MAYTHTHSAEVGNHLTNDGKEFGENDHLVGGEHTHEDVFLVRNPWTDQDVLMSHDPSEVTSDEVAEIDQALSAVPDEETAKDAELREQGSVVDNPDMTKPVNATPAVTTQTPPMGPTVK